MDATDHLEELAERLVKAGYSARRRYEGDPPWLVVSLPEMSKCGLSISAAWVLIPALVRTAERERGWWFRVGGSGELLAPCGDLAAAMFAVDRAMMPIRKAIEARSQR